MFAYSFKRRVRKNIPAATAAFWILKALRLGCELKQQGHYHCVLYKQDERQRKSGESRQGPPEAAGGNEGYRCLRRQQRSEVQAKRHRSSQNKSRITPDPTD